ncbi:chemotaxis protein CheW [Methylobacterium nigriterrae]|uniref:chemotaxis protein CheW n=1 Tax=Methylobacterium nigriterrae TaxID=3127512 RepID=UPI0030140AD3
MVTSEAARAETAAFLLLDVAGVPCALPRAAVSEILPLPTLFRPPAVGPLLAGFLNLGGAAVPVVDLARLFGLREEPVEPGPYAHLVLGADRTTAYLVDRVSDLVTVEARAIGPVSGAETLNGCVEAEISLGERLVHALSPARILTAEERGRLDALARAAQERLAALPVA